MGTCKINRQIFAKAFHINLSFLYLILSANFRFFIRTSIVRLHSAFLQKLLHGFFGHTFIPEIIKCRLIRKAIYLKHPALNAKHQIEIYKNNYHKK